MVAIEANFHPDAARTHQAGESRTNPLEKARTLQFPFSKKKETKKKKEKKEKSRKYKKKKIIIIKMIIIFLKMK